MVLTSEEQLGVMNWEALISEQLDIAETSILTLEKLFSIVDGAVVLHESVDALKIAIELVKYVYGNTTIEV